MPWKWQRHAYQETVWCEHNFNWTIGDAPFSLPKHAVILANKALENVTMASYASSYYDCIMGKVEDTMSRAASYVDFRGQDRRVWARCKSTRTVSSVLAGNSANNILLKKAFSCREHTSFKNQATNVQYCMACLRAKKRKTNERDLFVKSCLRYAADKVTCNVPETVVETYSQKKEINHLCPWRPSFSLPPNGGRHQPTWPAGGATAFLSNRGSTCWRATLH